MPQRCVATVTMATMSCLFVFSCIPRLAQAQPIISLHDGVPINSERFAEATSFTRSRKKTRPCSLLTGGRVVSCVCMWRTSNGKARANVLFRLAQSYEKRGSRGTTFSTMYVELFSVLLQICRSVAATTIFQIRSSFVCSSSSCRLPERSRPRGNNTFDSIVERRSAGHSRLL